MRMRLPPLLGAAQARLGAKSSRRRAWVESEPLGAGTAELKNTTFRGWGGWGWGLGRGGTMSARDRSP